MSDPKPRAMPYIWVTWLTGFLAGDQHCAWATWFKAHHSKYDKLPSSADLTRWKAQHNAMVEQTVEDLRAEGQTVFVENQNKFNLRGEVATLGGKPDAVALQGSDQATVIDCKTGQRRDSDYWQVLIYMLALPLTHLAVEGRTLRGEVRYRDGHSPLLIPPTALNDESQQSIVAAIKRAAADEEPPRVPSPSECERCDIGNCPDRVGQKPDTSANGLF